MNGINLDINILRKNLAFIREEITRITEVKKQLETGHEVRSDDDVRQNSRNLRGNTFKFELLVEIRV